MIKVYVRENNIATIVCPKCRSAKHFDAGKYRHQRHKFSVRCRCQHVFTVQLDFRRNFRKQTSLHGTYEVLSKGAHGGGIIHITNISRGGLGFTVSGLHDIQKGQLVQVEFQLNDKKKTVLNKQAVIRTVDKNSIGCEFCYNTDTDKALGFFLQN